MSRGLSFTCALLIACASSEQPIANVDGISSGATDIEIAPVQPSLPAKTSAAVVVTTSPPPPSSLCDQYWARSRACMENALKDVDPQVRASAMTAVADAEQQTRAVFEKLESAALNAACRTMLDTLALNPNCPEESR